jgi:hypothetical protein
MNLMQCHAMTLLTLRSQMAKHPNNCLLTIHLTSFRCVQLLLLTSAQKVLISELAQTEPRESL